MILKWLRHRRRRKILSQSFPETWERVLQTNVRYVQYLDDAQQMRLRQLTQIFVAEKYWEGCNGFTVTDEVKVTIAAQACLLLLTMPGECYNNVLSILVYPDEYLATETDTNLDGIVTERGQLRLGEAVWRGPVILSWPDVVAGGRGETYGDNLVLHEFAHQIDMMNGRFADGIPPLNSRAELDTWLQVMKPEYERLVDRCQSGHHGVIDCYGAVNEAEFFAVLTETFFERSAQLQMQHPEAYNLMKSYFSLHPAAW